MQGLHLTADLRGCPPAAPAMTDLAALRALCLDAVEAAGLSPVGELFHRFDAATCAALMEPAPPSPTAPVGITGVVLLAESHLAVHTWPELGAATLDVYVCNFGGDNSMRAHALMDRLVAGFEPTDVERHALTRGAPGSVAARSGTGSATPATA